MKLDLNTAYGSARIMCNRYFPLLRRWHDDIVQEVTLRAWLAWERGVKPTRAAYYNYTIDAVRKVVIDYRLVNSTPNYRALKLLACEKINNNTQHDRGLQPDAALMCSEVLTDAGVDQLLNDYLLVRVAGFKHSETKLGSELGKNKFTKLLRSKEEERQS